MKRASVAQTSRPSPPGLQLQDAGAGHVGDVDPAVRPDRDVVADGVLARQPGAALQLAALEVERLEPAALRVAGSGNAPARHVVRAGPERARALVRQQAEGRAGAVRPGRDPRFRRRGARSRPLDPALGHAADEERAVAGRGQALREGALARQRDHRRCGLGPDGAGDERPGHGQGRNAVRRDASGWSRSSRSPPRWLWPRACSREAVRSTVERAGEIGRWPRASPVPATLSDLSGRPGRLRRDRQPERGLQKVPIHDDVRRRGIPVAAGGRARLRQLHDQEPGEGNINQTVEMGRVRTTTVGA